MIIRTFISLVILFVFALFVPGTAKAGIISIDPGGRIMVKVLSAETSSVLLDEETHKVDVKKVKGVNMSDPSVALEKKDGKVSMAVLSDGGYQELDVTGVTSDLLEIEERVDVERLTVSTKDSGFVLKQGSFSALANYPVEIDAKNAKLSLVTSKGKTFLSVFPVEAVESALRSGIVTKIDNSIEIQETDEGLNYLVNGEKVFDIFGLTELKLPVTVSVSTANGHIVAIDSASAVYRMLKILFV